MSMQKLGYFQAKPRSRRYGESFKAGEFWWSNLNIRTPSRRPLLPGFELWDHWQI
jgi:hypothetical protein